jgi:hypothetical protein
VLLSRLSGALPLRHVARARGDALDPDHFTLLTDDRLAPVWDQLATFLAAPS